MLQALEAMESAGGLRRDALHSRHVAFEAPGGSHERARSAHGCDEMRDAPAGLLDDLRPGVLEMRLPVRRVVVLIGVKIAIGIGHVNFAAEQNGPVGAL